MPDRPVRVLFHVPRTIPASPSRGSAVHPVQMLEGFRSLGADVTLVDGASRERVRAMRRLVRSRELFDVVFSELLSIPSILADDDHRPRHPLADFSFFRAMRRRGAGVGAFYPDVYWRFPVYRSLLPMRKRVPTHAAHRLELAQLRSSIDVLFLPSAAMSAYVPYWPRDRIAPLAPGCLENDVAWQIHHDGPLRLLYAGAVTPPLYDISPVLDAVASDSGLAITVCCPAPERTHLEPWARVPNITVVHESGDALIERYRACDIACVAFREHPYRSFAMPVKLFEAIGMGRPVLAGGHDLVSEFVVEHKIGWAPGPDRIGTTLARLAGDRTEVARTRDAVLAIRPDHTWERRCTSVIDRLLGSSRDQRAVGR